MAEKTLEEIKADILHRAGRINPFERVNKADVEQVVKNITSSDEEGFLQLVGTTPVARSDRNQ